jgi:hypothetical protein
VSDPHAYRCAVAALNRRSEATATHDFAWGSRALLLMAVTATAIVAISTLLWWAGADVLAAPMIFIWMLLVGLLCIGAALVALPPQMGATRPAWTEYTIALALTTPQVLLLAYGLRELGRSIS